MQDPNEDTEWNDILRRKGIIPPKEEVKTTEDEIVEMLEQTIAERNAGKSMENMGLEELDDLEDQIDEEDERMFEQYRRQRLIEMKESAAKTSFGNVREISKADWVSEVNKAGEGIWVVIHIYKQGIPICALINQHLQNISRKFPHTKFLKGESAVCIPNYPDKNLPTIFVYLENDMKKQIIGPLALGGMKLSQDEFEWMLSEIGAVKTTLEENPRRQVNDVMSSATKNVVDDSDSDDGFH